MPPICLIFVRLLEMKQILRKGRTNHKKVTEEKSCKPSPVMLVRAK